MPLNADNKKRQTKREKKNCETSAKFVDRCRDIYCFCWYCVDAFLDVRITSREGVEKMQFVLYGRRNSFDSASFTIIDSWFYEGFWNRYFKIQVDIRFEEQKL